MLDLMTSRNEMSTAVTTRQPPPHAFKKGNAGGPGRPKGTVSGRVKTLQTLDRLLSTPAAQALIKADLEAKMMEDPGEFFLKFVAPFLPKEAILTLDRRGEEPEKAVVRVLHEVVEHIPDAARNIAKAATRTSTELDALEQRALPDPDTVEGEVVESSSERSEYAAKTIPARR